MDAGDETVVAPKRLRQLVSWQANRVGTIGTRFTLQRMSAGERRDFAALAALDEFGNLSQAEIGRHLVLDRNDVNAVASRLEEHGYIARRVNTDDRRRKVLTITPDGSAHLQRLQEHADVVQDLLLASLSEAERGQLIQLLDRVLAAHGAQPA